MFGSYKAERHDFYQTMGSDSLLYWSPENLESLIEKIFSQKRVTGDDYGSVINALFVLYYLQTSFPWVYTLETKALFDKVEEKLYTVDETNATDTDDIIKLYREVLDCIEEIDSIVHREQDLGAVLRITGLYKQVEMNLFLMGEDADLVSEELKRPANLPDNWQDTMSNSESLNWVIGIIRWICFYRKADYKTFVDSLRSKYKGKANDKT